MSGHRPQARGVCRLPTFRVLCYQFGRPRCTLWIVGSAQVDRIIDGLTIEPDNAGPTPASLAPPAPANGVPAMNNMDNESKDGSDDSREDVRDTAHDDAVSPSSAGSASKG